jgi:uroporphyrinogen decarboxylase
MYNWDSNDSTNIPLEKAFDEIKNGALVGGVDENDWLLKSTPNEVAKQIERMKNENDPSRLIIGPGCSIPPEVPLDNLRAVRGTL